MAIDNPTYPPGPRLTAGTVPDVDDPELAATIDAPGMGWMRLATLDTNQSNAVALDTPIPSSNNNIKISFDYTMWGGQGSNADGITVFLWDADIDFDPGAYGGSLGYAQRDGTPGLDGAFLGVGLDVYGNFSNDDEGRNGAWDSSDDSEDDIPGGLDENQIVLRGPDDSPAQDGTGDYYYLAGTGGKNYTVSGNQDVASLNGTTQRLDFPTYTARPDQDAAEFRRFEMELTDTNQLIVKAQFGFTGNMTTLFTADLSDDYFTDLRPDQLRIGFAAATGGSINVHEIRNLDIYASGSTSGRSNYWDDENGDNLWTTGANWNNNTVPVTYDFVVFSDRYPGTAAGSQAVTIDGGNKTHGSYTFSGNTSYALTANGGQLLVFSSNTSNKAYLNVLNSPHGNADHTINAGLRADDQLFIQNLVQQTLTLNGTINANGNPVTFATAGTTEAKGVVSGAGAITVKEDGLTIFSANNTYTGNTTVQNGILRLSGSGTLGATGNGTVVQSGATLELANGANLNNEALSLAGTGEGGIGALHNLSGNNTWGGTANLTLTANTTIASTAGTLTINGTGTLNAADQDLTFQTAAGSAITVNRVIADGGGNATDLLKTGTGTLTLGSVNTYDGTTTVAAGVVRVTNNNGLGSDTGDTIVNSGATLELAGGVTLPGAETLAISGAGVSGKAALWSDAGFNEADGGVTIAGGSATFGAASGATLRVDGAVSGSGQDAIITGAGTVEWASPMSYTGNTTVQSGTLQYADAGDRVVDTSNFTVASGATWDLANFSDAVGSLAGGGTVSLGSATLTAGGTNLSTTFSGNMGGTGNFVKAGTGEMTFSGNNSFSGNLTLDAGTVVLGANNTFANSMDLRMNGGTLQLTGFADTLDLYHQDADSTLDFTGTSGGLLTFAGAVGTVNGTNTVNNWIGNPLTSSAASTTTGFFVNSGSITGNMTSLATNTTFTGWGTGADWKIVTANATATHELVPTLTGAFRWDRADGNWSTATADDPNWVGDNGPPDTTAGTVVYFGDDEDPQGGQQNTAAPHTITLNGSRTVGTLILNGTGGRDYLFTSNNSTAQTLTFNQNGTATSYLTVAGSESHVIGSDAANLVNVSLNDNLLIQNNSSAATGLTLGTAGGNHTFSLNGSDLVVTGSSETVIHSLISGNSSSITKNGTGTLELNDVNTFTGGLTLNAGTLQVGNDAALGTGTFTVNGGTIEAEGGPRTITNRLDLNNTADNRFTVGGTSNFTFGGTANQNVNLPASLAINVSNAGVTAAFSANRSLQGAGSLTKEGPGTMTFASGNNSFSRGLNVNGGTVQANVATDMMIGASVSGQTYLGSGNVTVGSGATLNATATGSITLAGGRTLTNNGGTVSLNATATNSDINLGNSTSTGFLNLTAGNTTLRAADDLTIGPSSGLTASGGNLTLVAGSNFTTGGNSSANGAALDLSGTANATLTFSSAGGNFNLGQYDRLTVDGAARLTITGNGSSSATALAGNLTLSNGGVVTVNDGTTYLGATTRFSGGAAGTPGTLVVTGNLSVNEPLVSYQPNLTINATANYSITAPNPNSSITDLGTLTVANAAGAITTINSNVNNIEADQVIISGGTLLLGASDQLANTNDMVLSGGTFGTGGNDEILATLTLTTDSTIDMGSGSSILVYTDGGTRDAGTLTVTNWTGTPLTGGGTDQIIFGETLSAQFLAAVYWADSGTYGAIQLSTGEIVPIPETGTLLTGAGLTLLAVFHVWRRRHRQAAAAAPTGSGKGGISPTLPR